MRMKTYLLLGLTAAMVTAGAACNAKPPRPNAPRPRTATMSPALTDLTFQMGLGDHVVGISGFAHLPAGEDRVRLGDRADSNAENILSVQPDLLMIQQNPHDFDAVKKLRPSVRIEHFTIERLADIPAAMMRIGQLLGNPQAGVRAGKTFESQLAGVREKMKGAQRPQVLFVMGYERPGTGGGASFIHDMIETAGGQDAGAEYKRWANLDYESILKLSPEVVVCWVDPGQEQAAVGRWQEFRTLPAVVNHRVYIVSDPNWTIPTGKTPEMVAKLAEMIHPELSQTPSTLPASSPAGGVKEGATQAGKQQ